MVQSARQVVLTAARLVVELRDQGAVPYLDVRSLLDPNQSFLLPLPAPPTIDGMALATPLGRLHDISWGLAWGTGVPPVDCSVCFSTESLRFRRTAHSVPNVLAGHCWVADAEGVFTTAATVVQGVETARVILASRY